MLIFFRVFWLNKNLKNSNGQELEKMLEESKEMDIKCKENKGNDIFLVLESINIEKEISLEEIKIGEILIQGLIEDMVIVLIWVCVSMLGVFVDLDILYVIFCFCLRFIWDYKYVMMFVELKSICMILNLIQSLGFNGFIFLVIFFLRYIIEDFCIFCYIMEKVVCLVVISGVGSIIFGVVFGSFGFWEINYIFCVFGLVVCCNLDIFIEVVNCCICIVFFVFLRFRNWFR